MKLKSLIQEIDDMFYNAVYTPQNNLTRMKKRFKDFQELDSIVNKRMKTLRALIERKEKELNAK